MTLHVECPYFTSSFDRIPQLAKRKIKRYTFIIKAMNINIKTKNITLTSSIESYLSKKLLTLKKIVDLDADNVFAQVELGKTTNHHKSGNIFRAEINLRLGKKRIRAVSEKTDLYAAIDDMKDELSQEIKGKQEKQRTELRKGEAKIKDMVRGVRRNRS
jgi:ribosomal subunit interface protein